MSPITISTLKWPLYDRNEDSIKTENKWYLFILFKILDVDIYVYW